jgi:hypothetical protein
MGCAGGFRQTAGSSPAYHEEGGGSSGSERVRAAIPRFCAAVVARWGSGGYRWGALPRSLHGRFDPVSDVLTILGILVAYFVLQRWVLPAAGIPT